MSRQMQGSSQTNSGGSLKIEALPAPQCSQPTPSLHRMPGNQGGSVCHCRHNGERIAQSPEAVDSGAARSGGRPAEGLLAACYPRAAGPCSSPGDSPGPLAWPVGNKAGHRSFWSRAAGLGLLAYEAEATRDLPTGTGSPQLLCEDPHLPLSIQKALNAVLNTSSFILCSFI